MDNQQDQLGANTPNNANRPSQNPSSTPTPASTASGASAASRKSAPMPSGQSTAPTPNATDQNTANAGNARQSEGEQTQERTLLDTALNSGKKWIEDSGVLNGVNQLPQALKDLGNRAVSRVNDLSTTQKVVGGAILAVGLGWLATRKGGKSSSDSAPYNYGRQRDAGSYGRRSYGYQAPDASTSRTSASGAASRADSGSAYGNSGSRYGSSNTGIQAGSGRSEGGSSSHEASAHTDHGARTPDSTHRTKDDGFRSIE